MLYIPQIQKDDCGFACLKMLLANTNKDKSYLFLPQDEDHGQYSYSDLIELAYEHGVNLQAVRVTEKEELANCSTFPLIATTRLKNGALHAVLVMKVKWKRVTYIDPRRGKVTVSLKKFLENWDQTCLIIESQEKRKCTEKAIEPISMGTKVALGFIQIISGVFAVLGIYFIKDGTPIYMPAIFLSLAIISELLMRALSYRIMKNLDKYFFSDDNLPPKGFKEYLRRFEEYKKLSLSSPMLIILASIVALGLMVVILLNDRRNVMLVLVPVILSLFDVLVVSPMMKAKQHDIEDLENDLDNATDSGDLQSKVKVMHNAAYSYSYIDIATRYIYVGLMLMTALLTMHLCGISSFPFIIFYTCISATLYKALSSIFAFSDRMEKFNIVKVKITNYIKRPHK